MLYFKCPTCRTILANKQLLWETGIENICMNDKLSDIEKNIAKSKLLDDLQLKRECCRMRVMGFCNLIYIIK